MWIFQISDLPLVGGYVLVLVFLEGLLSADNALVLALMVRHLSRHDQRRVLQWGIWGAVGFRVLAVLLAAELRQFWYFKVIGGLYLLYLAISHFVSRHRSGPDTSGDRSVKPQGWWQGFWGTVTKITFADIAFSIDSILAAVGVAEGFPERFGDSGRTFIILTGGVLGIITMRFVVRYFILLLDRFPGLAEGAYFLVAWIGLKLVVGGFHDGEHLPFHIPEWLFWSGMGLIAILSLLIKPAKKDPDAEDAEQTLDLLESSEDDRPHSQGPSAEPGLSDGRSTDRTGPLDGTQDDKPVNNDRRPDGDAVRKDGSTHGRS
jgi:YkoY family integral membrane protein